VETNKSYNQFSNLNIRSPIFAIALQLPVGNKRDAATTAERDSILFIGDARPDRQGASNNIWGVTITTESSKNGAITLSSMDLSGNVKHVAIFS